MEGGFPDIYSKGKSQCNSFIYLVFDLPTIVYCQTFTLSYCSTGWRRSAFLPINKFCGEKDLKGEKLSLSIL